MINFLHTYKPNAILFDFGYFRIHWYGLMLAFGFIIGYFALNFLIKKYKPKNYNNNNKNKDFISTLLLYIVIPALIGARIYYVLYAFEFYKNNLITIFFVWEGGLAIHGVLLGGLFGLWLFCKKYKENFFWYLDLLSPCVAIGQTIGRFGNYFNQELYGKPTLLKFGIPIDSPIIGYESFTYFHPTFLYESFLNLCVFIILMLLHKKKLKNLTTQLNNNSKYLYNGAIFFVYLFLYSLIRFGMEFLRIDYSPIIFGIRFASFVSIILMCSSLLLYFYFKKSRT